MVSGSYRRATIVVSDALRGPSVAVTVNESRAVEAATERDLPI